ncbi:MAG TPA: SDR family oxidoreductase [Myxococcaceae bacterium]|nr:SDR family oxidoreductase [Myxococcaceae bacterium]
MADLTGKTVLVTGATNGIGLEASVGLARMGAGLVMVGRNPAKIAAKVQEVKQRSGSSTIESLTCDFSSQAQIRRMANEFRARHDRLHILVNNAGAAFSKRTVTEDGIESTFALNHLGYFLITRLLLDVLVQSAPARVVNVASAAHYAGSMHFEDLGFERGYRIMRAYARSKLANVLFTRELARRLEGTGVTVNSLHPGAVATGIWNGAPGWIRPVINLAGRFLMLTPAQGAESILYVATSPEVEGKTGLYFEKNLSKSPSPLACDDALASRLWERSSELVKLAA